MSETSPQELGERLQIDEDDLLMIDNRHEKEYNDWHIPDSVNVDVYDKLTDSELDSNNLAAE